MGGDDIVAMGDVSMLITYAHIDWLIGRDLFVEHDFFIIIFAILKSFTNNK